MLTGDIEPKRRIQGHIHTDPFAELEQDTPLFRKVLEEEHTRWKDATKPDISALRKEYEDVLQNALPLEEIWAHVKTKQYSIQYTYAHTLNIWIDGRTYKGVTDFVYSNGIYGIVQDIGDGSEQFECSIYINHKKQYSISPVGPNIGISDGFLYFTTPINRLRYNRVKRVNLQTGKAQKTIYIETNPKFNIELIQKTDVFIKSTNALHQKLDIILNGEPKRIITAKESLFPCTEDVYLTNTHVKPFGALPRGHNGVDILQHDAIFYIITVSDAHHTCWKYQDGTFVEIKTAPAMRFLTYAEEPTLLLSYPYKPSEVFVISNKSIILAMPSLIDLDYEFRHVRDVPYSVVWEKGTPPHSLIISAYGAYGIESQRDYPIRWIPWIRRGFGFVVAAPRGGRDKGDHWYDEGRTAPRKHTTFDDTASVVRAAQKHLGIPASRTIVYGRSAGGWTAAMMALQHVNLIRGIIAEVPYVDVLRTTSNPKLPLTTLEYDEFGDPLHSKQDYQALLKISPVDLAHISEPNECMVLLKTALHDSEVATYESLKFAAALRSRGWTNVFVNIDDDGGHFVGRNRMANQFAEDTAFYLGLLRPKTATRSTRKNTKKGKGTVKRSSMRRTK